jgi:hypothetical protein
MTASLTRRAFLGSAALGALAAGRRPNVLFIPVDDMNDWVAGFGGHPQTITPNIARIEKRGMMFQRAYCNAPMCNPSRASRSASSETAGFVTPIPARIKLSTAILIVTTP